MGCFFGCAISVNWLARKHRSNIHALTKEIDELNMMVRIEEHSKKLFLKKAAEDCEKAIQCYDKDYRSIHLKGKELNVEVHFLEEKRKKEVLDDAVKAIKKIIESCENEERRLSDEVKTVKGNITTLGDEDPNATERCMLKIKLAEKRIQEINKYIHVLIHEISYVEMHHITRQVAHALKIGDNAKY